MSRLRRGSSSRFGGRASAGSLECCINWSILTAKVILILLLLTKIVFLIIALIAVIKEGPHGKLGPSWVFYVLLGVLGLLILVNLAIIGMIACECAICLCITIIVYLFLLGGLIYLEVTYGDKEHFFTSAIFIVPVVSVVVLIGYNILLCFG